MDATRYYSSCIKHGNRNLLGYGDDWLTSILDHLIMEKKHIQNFIILNISMLFVSTSGVLGRIIALPPPLTIWSRSIIAFVLLGGYVFLKKISFQINFRKNGGVVFLSGVLMAAHWVTYFFALQWSNVAIGMLSLFTYPILTVLMEPFFFPIRYQKRHLGLGVLILLGVFLLAPSYDLDNDITKGILMGLISSFCYSLRNVMLKKRIASLDGSVLMFYQMGISALLLLPALFYFEAESFQAKLPFIFLLGILTTAIGHTLFLNSFKHFSIGTVSIMSGIQPIYGILLGLFFLNEIPSYRSTLGGLLIILTVLIEQRSTRSTPDKKVSLNKKI
ncbi:MAG: DMT family transporter [Bacteroidetes bacterium]|nr:DMT family transporter [Bacteroidota bacterium]